ncbi:MAG TPA: acyl-CoA dehydrogenase family protein [Rhodoferax sp.]|jgi:acyl-CoA dehydrogenase|nr:acyl-CoA dehydrogenase family protein [Rhodoferax sp.]HPW83656.1 acyl-CoA dehydrogenase family protein [Rhodoferax sp.]HQC86064.1 acyl-CoA dehydrogenase family protein [Rhodoferax sp.]HQY77038.1 acyl-CoA dehydrogenase family protein [Rhodoferax sp.]
MSVYEIADEDIALVEDAARKFVQTEVAPHLGAWEEAGEIPRSLYQRAAEMGWLEMGYPEEFGGTPSPWKLRNALTIALARAGGSGGLMASLFSHNIGLPPVVRHGSPELQRKVIPDVLAGKKIAALAITEPGGGTDVSALKTTARREGDEYVIDGEKVFITSGVRADWLTVAVRTDLKNKGPMGISMVMVPGDAVGLSRSPLKKMGWLCSDTAQIRFDGVRVPVSNLVGEEGSGFKMILTNFNGERLSMAALSLGFAEACYDEALSWAQQRKTFGTALIDHQVIRHKFMDMKMRIESTRAWLNAVSARADAGDRGDKSAKGAEWVAQVCLLKNHATQTMQFCADQGVQILGGMGFMRGTTCERVYREVKVMMIGGGAEEIMKELASRQLGL